MTGSRPSSIASASRTALKVLAAAADVVRPPAQGLVILIYHRVGGGTGSSVDLSPNLFEEQMSWLAAHGGVLSLDDGIREVESDAPADGRVRVVVTFDDGTDDFVDRALPILERHGMPATLYLATDFVERQCAFPGGERPASWSGLADALSTGLVTIGSHTHTHALLDRLPSEAVDAELDRSIDLIGERLGVSAQHFAYPKALPGSPTADRAVRRRFSSAAVAGTRPNPYGGTDVYALGRSPIQAPDGMRWFVRKANGGLWAEDSVRRLVNRRRYAGATS